MRGGPSQRHVSFGIVVSTLGRVDYLERLLLSIVDQEYDGCIVAICVQKNLADVEAMLERLDLLGLDVRLTTSPMGASRGRNVAASLIGRAADYLLFPNDTSRLTPGLLRGIADALAGEDAGAVTVLDEYGPKFVLPDRRTPLDPENVWQVILPGMLMRREVFEDLGGFDEELGTGATTPWQSGEETDILLRCLRAYGSRFAWLGDLVMDGIADSRGLTDDERRRKLRGYGRGYGRILSIHSYPTGRRLRAIVGGFSFGIRHTDQFRPLDGMWVGLGRVEGILGHAIGAGAIPQRAVSR